MKSYTVTVVLAMYIAYGIWYRLEYGPIENPILLFGLIISTLLLPAMITYNIEDFNKKRR